MASISSREDLEAWLEDKPKEWAQLIAVRAALRVLPLTSLVKGDHARITNASLIFAAIRANAISWGAAKIPPHDMAHHRASSYAASYAASAAAASAASSDAASSDAASAAAAASSYAASYAASAAASAAAAAASDAAAAATWQSMLIDAGILEKTRNAYAKFILWDLPIWAEPDGKDSAPLPQWAAEATSEFEQYLAGLGDDWHVWAQWYRALLAGHAPWGLADEPLEAFIFRLIKQDNHFWERGPAAVNADIAAWIEELRGNNPKQALIETLASSSPSEFIAKGGKLSATTRPAGIPPAKDNDDARDQLIESVGTRATKIIDDITGKPNNIPEPTEVVVPLRNYVAELGDARRWFRLDDHAQDFKALMGRYSYETWGGTLEHSCDAFQERHRQLEPFLNPDQSLRKPKHDVPAINISQLKNVDLKISIATAEGALASLDASKTLDGPSLETFQDLLEETKQADAQKNEPDYTDQGREVTLKARLTRLTTYTADFITSVSKDVITKALTDPDAAATLANRLQPLFDVLLRLFGA